MDEGMDNKYQHIAESWDAVFQKEETKVPKTAATGNSEMDKGLDWLCGGVSSVLDFGCGSGSLLFHCALLGVEQLIGVDISQAAVDAALKSAGLMKHGQFTFISGGIEKLSAMKDASIDAVILSNIVDNLYPEDARILMSEVTRILKPAGRAFIKLNPYITEEQIVAWKIRRIEDNVLDDGLILWNNTTAQWETFLSAYLSKEEYLDVYFREQDQHNRLFLMTK
jgi:ubiquinone/menaquinone biosynthesis C-methylase UbiE